jgi:hypothetical protein
MFNYVLIGKPKRGKNHAKSHQDKGDVENANDTSSEHDFILTM